MVTISESSMLDLAVDNKSERKLRKTFSTSSKRSTTSIRSSFKKSSTKSIKKTQFSMVEKEKNALHDDRDQKEERGIHEIANAEKREEPVKKIELKLMDFPDEEHDRRLFNSTMSSDHESDIRYNMDDTSVGYEDVGCCKIPALCKFTQGTWSIDEDDVQERYNTYDETYNRVMASKHEERIKAAAAAALKPAVENFNHGKKEIVLPLRPKKADNTVPLKEKEAVPKPETNETDEIKLSHSSSLKSNTSISKSPIEVTQTESLDSVNCSPSLKTENSTTFDVKTEASVIDVEGSQSAHAPGLKEKAEISSDDAAADTIVSTVKENKIEKIEQEENITSVKDSKNVEKKNLTDKKKKSKVSISFFKKKKKSSEKQETKKTEAESKKKKSLLSFLKKSKTKKSSTKSNKENKSKVEKEDFAPTTASLNADSFVEPEIVTPEHNENEINDNEIIDIQNDETKRNSNYDLSVKIDEMNNSDTYSRHSTLYSTSTRGEHSLSSLSLHTPDISIKQVDTNITDTNSVNQKISIKQVDTNITDTNSVNQKNVVKNITPEDDHDYMSLDYMGESLGSFISVAGDKLYDTYMGFGQKEQTK